MNILAIIPARGGSKGVPRKNIKKIAGKPLIAHTIESAVKSKYINKVIVSTEDQEIANISKEYGAEVIERPEKLALDDSSTIDAVFHSINHLKMENYTPDVVVLLQPTSPLRTVQDIDGSIEFFCKKDCESVISICEFEHPPYWSLKIENSYLKPAFGDKYFKMRRQDLPTSYLPNGAIFISNPQNLASYESFYCKKTLPYLMSLENSVDIDTELDFKIAETILKELK
ncbi:cytidylyltransferase domain-containing protein [Methanobacterium sp. MBAC-LM]|uniref:acylneuraminate cytidylyltransferase family protein n=1 Tax=Methanobacterium sp. MBAC-LM TaxID=3412034 RepID=UPI003C7765C6